MLPNMPLRSLIALKIETGLLGSGSLQDVLSFATRLDVARRQRMSATLTMTQ